MLISTSQGTPGSEWCASHLWRSQSQHHHHRHQWQRTSVHIHLSVPRCPGGWAHWVSCLYYPGHWCRWGWKCRCNVQFKRSFRYIDLYLLHNTTFRPCHFHFISFEQIEKLLSCQKSKCNQKVLWIDWNLDGLETHSRQIIKRCKCICLFKLNR